jgi:hypothetical protein
LIERMPEARKRVLEMREKETACTPKICPVLVEDYILCSRTRFIRNSGRARPGRLLLLAGVYCG